MKVLGIDTSTMTTSLALTEDDVILGEYSVTGGIRHSERVMEMLKELFLKQPFTVRDVDLFVAGRGPGSFTGLRIGITIIKTLAQALGKEAMGISTLRGFADDYPGDGWIVPILDARRHRVYTGAYLREEGELKNIIPDTVISWEDWMETLGDRPVIMVGPGCDAFREEIEGQNNIILPPGPTAQIRASRLCLLGRRDYLGGARQNLYEITPNYVKKSQAERELEGKFGDD